MGGKKSSWLRGAGLAAITGSRTALGPALVCRSAVKSAPLRACAYVASALELVGDKLPRTPNRTAPLGLVLRIVSGAGVVRALVRRGRRRERGSSAGALLLGAAAAVLGAFAGLRLRVALTRRLGGGPRASAIAGAIEDAALLLIGTRLAPTR
jgi:uncharacterized membrane protein